MGERGFRLTRRAAERLLHRAGSDDVWTSADPVRSQLAGLIADAGAPGGSSDLGTGEGEALAHFRAYAATASVPRPDSRRPSMRQRLGMLSTATKAAIVVAVATTTTGGVALASANADQLRSIGGQFVGGGELVRSASDDATSSPTDSTGPTDPTGSPTGPGESETKEPNGTPSPNLRGLCRAHLAGAESEGHTQQQHARQAGRSPAFRALVTAAGGPDAVDGYCAELLRSEPTGSPTVDPTGTPTGDPTGTPTGDPTSTPTDKPTGGGKPSDKPTGGGKPSKPPGKPSDPTNT